VLLRIGAVLAIQLSFYCEFIVKFGSEKILTGENLVKLQAKRLSHVSIRNVLLRAQFALADPYTTYLKTATIYLEINIHCWHMVYLFYVRFLLT